MSALLADGIWDALSWVTLSSPLAVIAGLWLDVVVESGPSSDYSTE
jgi:hypothetical protein